MIQENTDANPTSANTGLLPTAQTRTGADPTGERRVAQPRNVIHQPPPVTLTGPAGIGILLP